MAQALSGGLRLLASAAPGEVRVALLRGDVLVEYWVDRADLPDGVGDLHRARVTALAPAMAGAFLALAGGETGFLPDDEAGPRRGAERLQEGLVLPVRVMRAAQGGKGPRLSARLTEREAALAAAAPAGAPRLLVRGPGPVLRLARAHPAASVTVDHPALAAALRGALGRERVALLRGPAFDDALEAEIDALAGPEAPLPGGQGRILVHPTPALTAIDVDAGAAAGARDPAAQERLNLLAVREAARQIRLRNLAGPILLDLAGLSAKRRAALAVPFEAALAEDGLAQMKGIGPLGLFEVLRRRVHPPLHEVLGGRMAATTAALAALRRAAREAAANPGRALALRAAPAVVAAAEAMPQALAAWSAETGRPLALLADPAVPPGAERIEEAETRG